MSAVEPSIHVIKHGVTIPLSHTDVAVGQEIRWEFISAMFDKSYRRKVLSKTWVKVSKDALEKYKTLMVKLSEVEDELWEIGAGHDVEGEWSAPTGHYEYEYGETYDEWIERCKQLDAAAK